MLFANDYNDRRVHIDETQSNQEYYCPSCGAPLVVKKGVIRQHHFAHKKNHVCKDTWERSGSNGYDVSPWHNNWQSMFPKDNQEVRLHLGKVCHRADVLVDRTVVEFQHSILQPAVFDDRNNFYLNLDYKVVWLFDISDIYKEGKISYIKEGDSCLFSWTNPKRTFSAYDINKGEIELFFHIAEEEKEAIYRVKSASIFGFERFRTGLPLSREQFLEYVGLEGGKCAAPYREDVEKNQQFEEFCNKYGIDLSKQQESALLAVEGANLLLAVPGSGKTTVLINRIGHMVINKGIQPESILAITYTKNAAVEMRQRFSERFGKELGERIDFRTINSLCNDIYLSFCAQKGKKVRRLISKESERREILAGVYKRFRHDNATENEKIEFGQYIGCIKNLMLEEDQIIALEDEYPQLNKMYKAYQNFLRQTNLMDFDDQMVFAHELLAKRPAVLKEIRSKYHYICVDEAQDTSKIQHAIIRMIAYGQSLFMVGDEDQSIYGFRAAFPRAMLNFRYDYVNPYILRMERNYRSTAQIVELAQRFISKNKGRYTKEMVADRGNGEPIELIRAASRKEQFDKLIDIARYRNGETAFLFRDNESSVLLIDLLLRNGIPFMLKKPEMNFFGMRTVKRIIDCLRRYNWAENPADAIARAYAECYPGRDIERDSRLDVLKLLAAQENNLKAFLGRVAVIENVIRNGSDANEADALILSTIHSSKGLEYDHVCLVDVYDGRFPSSKTNPFSHSKDDPTGEQEERRLFYVGVTRAKNKLTLFSIKDKQSSYIEELCPEIRTEREEEERKKAEEERKRQDEERLQRKKAADEQRSRELEEWKIAHEKLIREEEEQRRIEAEQSRLKREQEKREQEQRNQERIEKWTDPDCPFPREVLSQIEQKECPARDKQGKRWVMCTQCKKIKSVDFFDKGQYGGEHKQTRGICRKCLEKMTDHT
ncbi:MAG: UvrD-helicase domain-containing protein [Clostridiales bacterium]|nr:UvrD-helicase domain-containing protein [Clostridiales bacterium]